MIIKYAKIYELFENKKYICWCLFGVPNTTQELAAVLSAQTRTVRGQGSDGP
jgi:hypothetical protein